MEVISFNKSIQNNSWRILLSLFSIFTFINLRNYIIWDSAFILALTIFPLFIKSQKRETSVRLTIPILVLTMVNMFIQINIVKYLMLVLSIALIVEFYLGKINTSYFILTFVVSPYSKFVHSTYSYDLREQLGKIIEKVFKILNFNIEIHGNLVEYDHKTFAIDPGCAGIQMMFIGFVIGIAILINFENSKKIRFNAIEIFLSLLLLFLLNLANNLMRIIFLIYFIVLPDNILHDIIGIFSLILFTLLPFAITAYLYATKKKNIQKIDKIQSSQSNRKYWLYSCLTIVILSTSFSPSSKPHTSTSKLNLKGYKSSELSEGIVKYSNKSSIIYQKPTFIFKSEHNPMVCWQGSGYDLQQLQTKKIGNHIYKMGKLISGKDTLYTAWWFDNGINSSIDQWEWRKEKIKNSTSNYYLINISTENYSQLISELKFFNANKKSIWAFHCN